MIGTFEDAIWLFGEMAGFKTRPSLIRVPEKRPSLIDAIIGEIKVNLGLEQMFGFPEYRYK